MSRRNNWLLAMIGLVLLAPHVRGDEVGTFLERHGLRTLLAVHLEEQLESARGEQRDLIVRRLADLYAELLESVEAPGERKGLEARGRDLVVSLPDQDAGSLRLALLRGSYRTAEKIAENHRLRISTAEEIETAKALLTDIIPKFNQLGRQLDNTIKQLERRLARAGGLEASSMFREIEEARAMRDECMFYNAWALYYQSWLHERRDNARVAIRHFADVLGLDPFNPDREDVSVDLRSMEAIARSILGIALCKSMTTSGPTAINWIALIEHANTFEPLRLEAPVWRIAIWLEHDEFDRVRDEIGKLLREDREIPAPWLRLIAVHTLERGGRNRQAQALVQYAVTELAAREALDQVLDIAKRYGTEALGDEGFALLYVSGVMTYSDARTIHDSELPTMEPALVAQYEKAVADLEAALKQDDVDQYPDPAASCERLIGYCHYFRGKFLDARHCFLRAAAQLRTSQEAAEALWMAIVSLDKVVEARSSDSLRVELDDLMSRFLREYPASVYAPKITLKQAMSRNVATTETVETLLDIPENSDVYFAARRRAAQGLYDLFRASQGTARQAHARRFIDVSLPNMSEMMRRQGRADGPSVLDMITRVRMLLEVSLADGVFRLAAARQGFAWLEELEASHGADLQPYADELDHRRLVERLQTGDVVKAREFADAMWQREPLSIWSRLSSRALFNYGHRLWQMADSPADVDIEIFRIVDTYGGHVLYESADNPKALGDRAILRYHATVAEAAKIIWERTGEANRGQAALMLYERLLRERPANASFLQATALLSERLGKPEQALNCWRTILAGSEVRSDQWFEAKFHQIAMLIELEQRDRAETVLLQHLQLNPDYGPDPWGARLKGLEEQLNQTASIAPVGDEGGGP